MWGEGTRRRDGAKTKSLSVEVVTYEGDSIPKSAPRNLPTYCMTPTKHAELKRHFNELFRKGGFIYESLSPCATWCLRKMVAEGCVCTAEPPIRSHYSNRCPISSLICLIYWQILLFFQILCWVAIIRSGLDLGTSGRLLSWARMDSMSSWLCHFNLPICPWWLRYYVLFIGKFLVVLMISLYLVKVKNNMPIF